MSWLSLAKNALKEAQNKIDKVLDIQGDGGKFIRDGEELYGSALLDVDNTDSKSIMKDTDNRNLGETGVCLDITLEPGKISNSSSAATIISINSNASETKQFHADNVELQHDQANKIVNLDNEKSITTNIDNAKSELPEAENIKKKDDHFGISKDPKMDLSMLTDFVQISDNTYKNLLDEDKTLSAEEVETTTSSSDIEIISNPNGDSSSTNSICRGVSPINLCPQNNIIKAKKRLCRESSETSIEFEYNQSEADKLLQRISELNEALENHEMRLLEVSRQNSTLMEKNAEYQRLLEVKQKNREIFETGEMQRLSSLEKKHQMSIRERDALREQLNSLSSKIPKGDLNKMLSEKDLMIEELRTEGESLSKQILTLSDIIKKIRFKERDNISNLKKDKHQIDSLTDEVDRLKKSLTAKDELERSQIDAVNKLSSTKAKLEKENQTLNGQIEVITLKLITLQDNFEATKAELRSKQQLLLVLNKKAQAAETLENQILENENRNLEIMLQSDELKQRFTKIHIENSQREQKLRRENCDLLNRLESAELRAENLTKELSLSTIPLVKLLEELQTTFNNRTAAWERQEKELLLKLKNSQDSIESCKNTENKLKNQQIALNSTIRSLEDRLQHALLKSEELNSSMQQMECKFIIEISEYKKKINEYEHQLKESRTLIVEFQDRIDECQKNKTRIPEDLNSEDANTLDPVNVADQHQQVFLRNNRSPSFCFEHNSLSESLHSAGWQQMEDLEVVSNSGVTDTGLMFSNLGRSAAMYENFQSALKQKDGEISHLQWDLSRMQIERNFLNNEISNLTSELMEIKEQLNNNAQMKTELSELKNQYDALLQMYGEKVEETQELELDLQDIKDMYKAQIDELLNQKKIKLNC